MNEANLTGSDASGLPLTDAARRLLAEAHHESDRLQQEYVGCEHLVLALTGEGDDTALLARLGVDTAAARGVIEGMVHGGYTRTPLGMRHPYTSRTKSVFALALESARELGHARVGVEHLLVGLMRERLNAGAQLLHHHYGLTADRALAEAQRLGVAGSAP